MSKKSKKKNIATSLLERSRMNTENSMRALCVYFKYMTIGDENLLEVPGGGIFQYDIPSLVLEFMSGRAWKIIRPSVSSFVNKTKLFMMRFACRPNRTLDDDDESRCDSKVCRVCAISEYIVTIYTPTFHHPSHILPMPVEECNDSDLKALLDHSKKLFNMVLLKLGDTGVFDYPIPSGLGEYQSMAQYLIDERIRKSQARSRSIQLRTAREMENKPSPEMLIGSSFRISLESLSLENGATGVFDSGWFIGHSRSPVRVPVSMIVDWRVVGYTKQDATPHAPYSLIITPDNDQESPKFTCKMRLRWSWRLDISPLAPRFAYSQNVTHSWLEKDNFKHRVKYGDKGVHDQLDLYHLMEWRRCVYPLLDYTGRADVTFVIFKKGERETWRCPLTFDIPPVSKRVSSIVDNAVGVKFLTSHRWYPGPSAHNNIVEGIAYNLARGRPPPPPSPPIAIETV